MPTARDRPPEEAAEDTSFARGLRVLLTIADRGAIRADELGTLLETPLSTIYRYLRTLTEFGFVDRHDGGYRLGPRLLIGGGATVSSEELIRRADPVLAMLAEETGETAVISRRVGLAAVCLHQQPSAHALRVALEPGVASPLDIGAIALVLLAYAPRRRPGRSPRAARLTPTRPDWPSSSPSAPTASPGARACAIPGVVTIAVPVMRDDGIVAALAVLAPEGRATLAWRTRSSRVLIDAAGAISRALRPTGAG